MSGRGRRASSLAAAARGEKGVALRGSAWLLAGVGLALGAAACASDDESPESAACQPLCAAVQSCDQRATAAACQSWCGDLRREAQVRAEVIYEMGECAKVMGCGALKSGDYWPPCWQAMRPRIGATEGSVAYCELVSEREFECGYDVDVMACVEDMKYFDQALLDRAAGCTAAPTCEALEACFASTFSLPCPSAGPGVPVRVIGEAEFAGGASTGRRQRAPQPRPRPSRRRRGRRAADSRPPSRARARRLCRAGACVQSPGAGGCQSGAGRVRRCGDESSRLASAR